MGLRDMDYIFFDFLDLFFDFFRQNITNLLYFASISTTLSAQDEPGRS